MRKLALESAAVLAVIITAVLALDHAENWSDLGTPQLRSSLAMFSAAVAITAALVAELVARLGDLPALRRVSAAMAVYALIVIPATAAVAVNTVDNIVVAAVRYSATIAVGGLLLLAVATFDRPRPWPVPGLRNPLTGLRGLLVGVLCAVLGGTAAALFPTEGYAVVSSPLLVGGVSLLWLNVGATTLISGLLRHRRFLVWLGLGSLASVSGYAPRLWLGEPSAGSFLLVPGMRALGVLLTLVAVLQLAYHLYQQIAVDQRRLEEAQAEAVEVRERMSEQAHELRNALAGVDGAAQLLAMEDSGGADLDRAALRAALSAELNRMRTMLESESARRPASKVHLKALLEQLVLIRRTNGMRIELTAEHDVDVDVPPDVIAQIITNILANCERHAPGARVWVEAYRLGTMAQIRIQDDGPGVPAGMEHEVLCRGVKSAKSVGDGIGLHVCQELVTQHGGRLRLAPTRPDRPGCVLTVDLPIEAGDPAPSNESPRRSHRGARTRWLGARRPSGASTAPTSPSTPTSFGSANAGQ
ncbi:sensor histidine kinase [Nocardiopsis ansamitocini]|uniref:histidine kinase n=1 Tax=Nocardiopsis ansamitocini TaxID=1670832 RepID=A0A9W6P4F7_9ACTN|nr:HAMP domain-containing sensor histidine kinase [Nocardiopsis ansamitocini]GLU47144.1 hypothetical protein Nans01_14950 [Nocardiopsis ansamitocini]